ncbi:tyrosine-type recombinase/integrase [Pseudomonas sp. NPDC090202]|uniref:tyrosine-type recombinase/integrase n=1 Tax=Pseudomonas sp. NPDC090202 TaxID=3364476 RepID=UPI00381E001E
MYGPGKSQPTCPPVREWKLRNDYPNRYTLQKGRKTMALRHDRIGEISIPGVYQDKNGLSLKVRASGSRSWTLRYQFNGKRHDVGLGSYPEVGLADARKKATELRAQIAKGIDPLEQRKEAAIASVSVDDTAATYIERHSLGWSTKHTSQWRNSIATYVSPLVGQMAIAEMQTHHVTKILDPIWMAKPETARRVRNRLETLIDFAESSGHFRGDNPARWKGHLQNIMPKQSVTKTPMKAMEFSRMPYFMLILDGEHSREARCLQFLILTACRTTEALGATWDEIDMINRVWTIPAERMKGKEVHQVPLSEEAIQVLKDTNTRGRSELVFPAARSTEQMQDNALRRLLEKIGEDCTVHGFRSTFRTWAAEKTAFSHELCELAIAHVVGTPVSRTYVRGNQLEKRRPLMARWAKFAMDRVNPTDPVIANTLLPESTRTFL